MTLLGYSEDRKQVSCTVTVFNMGVVCIAYRGNSLEPVGQQLLSECTGEAQGLFCIFLTLYHSSFLNSKNDTDDTIQRKNLNTDLTKALMTSDACPCAGPALGPAI